MAQVLLVANWKQIGTRKEARVWTNALAKEKALLTKNIQIIVCPPLPAVDLVAQEIENENLPVAIGLQDIDSRVFEGEKNTGEISPRLFADSASFVIVGHSETRKNHNLRDDDVAQKVKIAQDFGLTPIVCISEMKHVEALKTLHPNFNGIIAYEPLFAIGTGHPDTPENANHMALTIKDMLQKATVIYGGSVDGSNVATFLAQKEISGVLVGHRSANSAFFLEIIRQACFLTGSKVKNAS